LWLKAMVSARDAEALAGISGGWFTVEGGARTHAATRVVSVGSVIDPVTRTVPVYLAVPNADASLKIGMLADAQLLVGDPVAGVAIPTAGIQDEDGLPVAYVKVGGEAFQRRILQIGPSDGLWTIVHSGVAAGEQVVSVGAYQVKLASFGDAEISDHGHPH
jgi:multidrug efflux pump subunit AcrA (membrane-fusion protein)